MGRTRPQRHQNHIAQTGRLARAALCASAFTAVVSAAMSLWAAPAVAQRALMDKLVAVVGGKPVTFSDIRHRVEQGPLVVLSPFPSTTEARPTEQALNDLINLKLVELEAEKLGIVFSDDDLEAEIDAFAKKRNLTVDKLKEILAAQGMPYDQYKRDFKTQLIASKFQGRVILPQVNVSDKDIEVFLLSKGNSRGGEAKLQLRKLFIAVPDQKSELVKKTKKQLIDKIHNELKNGLVFSEAVKVYSDSAFDRKNGGLIPSVNLSELSPAFQKQITPLSEGEITEPIPVPSGYFIFKLEKKFIDKGEDYQKVRRQAEFALRKQKAQQQLNRWLEVQRRKTRIELKSES